MSISSPETHGTQPADDRSSTNYEALLAEARKERGDPLSHGERYVTQGRTEDPDADELRAYAARPKVDRGLELEKEAAKLAAVAESGPRLARLGMQRGAARLTTEANTAFRGALDDSERARKLKEELDNLTDPDRKA